MKRRDFLKTLPLAAGSIPFAFNSNSQASTFNHILRRTKKRVLVIGGGVGGMTAAHELAERGFEVSVYELNSIPGGKARSMPVPGSGQEGRQDLPGEHGFRFFPGFYTHLDDTMSRIPFGNGKTAFDNLTPPPRMQFARAGQPEVLIPTHIPRNLTDLRAALKFLFRSEFQIPRDDFEFFARRLLQLLTSCDERRYAEYERIPWWDFIEADGRSENFRRYMVTGLTRCLVACQPRTVSARTGGYIFLQLLLSLMGQNKEVDRILNGPTNEKFIFPWLAELRRMGVRYHMGANCESLYFDGTSMVGARIAVDGIASDVYADHVVLAVPCEVASQLITPAMKQKDNMLARIDNLQVEWMNGLQFYLTEDVLPHIGHSIYFDSPWAVTSISQKSHWSDVDLSQYGDGRVKGILSVDISDWKTPGILFNKPAKNCTKEEIIEEAWAQMKSHLNESSQVLRDDMRITAFLDPAIGFPAPGSTTNSEPLLVNTAGSWYDRPLAASGEIDNFYIASDYVQTYMDLASMESACEAARRATNLILDRAASDAPRTLVDPLQEPAIFAPFKEYDRRRFERGLEWDPSVIQRLS